MKLTLTNETLVLLTQSIETLNHPQYVFTAVTRLTLARNLAALHRELAPFGQVKDKLLLEHGIAGEVKPGDRGYVKFTEEFNAITRQTVTVDLESLASGDLNLGKNAIPITALCHLLVLIPKPEPSTAA